MKTGKSIKGVLNYNEDKVRRGTADLVFASHFGGDVSNMNFSQKLRRFEKLTELNEKSQTNTLHLSLNFSPDDVLDTEVLQTIAADYMQRIGFGNQPFLVYQHHDAHHPHLHIVTTTIQANGKPIYLHNIGKTKSEPARKAIELEYGLVRAESKKQAVTMPLVPIAPERATYGQMETKRAISNIVLQVIAQYKFSSLAEFNSVLRQYNVMADRGNPTSRMYENKGLVYTLIDKSGYKIGVPIKASSIYSSPTISTLEKKFVQNKERKERGKAFIKSFVNRALDKSSDEIVFRQLLAKNNLDYRKIYNRNSEVTAIHFIDNKNKSIFTNTELEIDGDQFAKKLATGNQHNLIQAISTGKHSEQANQVHQTEDALSFDVLKELLSSENVYDDISPEFLRKKKRKKKR